MRRNIRTFVIQMPLLVAGLMLGRESALEGLEGLSIALVVSAIANATINMLLIRKLIASPLTEQLGLAARPFFASVIMASLVLLLVHLYPATGSDLPSILKLAAMMIAGAFAFAASLFALHAVFGGPASAERELVALALGGLAKAKTGVKASRRNR